MIARAGCLSALAVFTLIGVTATTSEAQSQNPSEAGGAGPVPPASSMTPSPGSAYSTPITPPPQLAPPLRAAPYPGTATSIYSTETMAPAAPMPAPAPTGYPSYVLPRPVHDSTLPNTNSASLPFPPVTDWSIGAGLQYSTLGDLGMTGLASGFSTAGGATVPSIRMSVFLERRLWNHIYFLFQPDFDYRKYHHENPDASSAVMIDRSTSAGLSAGLRWVANPGGTVELGMTHVVDADWTYASGSGPRYRTPEGTTSLQTNATMFTYDVGLSTGIVAEYKLMTQLWLRIHVPFLRAAYSAARLKYNDQNGSSSFYSESTLNVALFAAPRLELRLTW